MKNIVILLLFVSSIAYSQQHYNLKKGYLANGYDVVAYFKNSAKKGNKKFTTTYNGVKLKFSSAKNLKIFKASPKKYLPQYGGFCAYAIGKTGEKVAINPKTFEIRNGMLFLFYNAWGTNTLELWLDEGAEKLKEQADLKWKKLLKKPAN